MENVDDIAQLHDVAVGPAQRFRPSALGWWLLVITAGGALLRGARLATKWSDPLLLNDSIYYSVQGYQIAHGTFFEEVLGGQPGAEHGPLTPLVLAFVSWVSEPIRWQRLLTALLGVATIPLIGLIGKKVAGTGAAVIAAVLAALYPNLWINDGLVMSESLAALLIAAQLLVMLHWLDRRTPGLLVATGLITGLAVLTRSEMMISVPLFVSIAVVAARRRGRRGWAEGAVIAGTVVLVLLPWMGYNVSRFERPVLMTTNDGGVLLGSNCPESYYGPALGGWSLFCVLDDVPEKPDADTSVRNARQRAMGIDYARENLERIPVVVAARVARLLDLYALDNLVVQDVGEEREHWASWAGIVCFWILAPLSVVGLLRVRRSHRAVLVAPVVVSLATAVLFYGAHRMRISAEPAIVVGAAVSLSAIWSRRGSAVA